MTASAQLNLKTRVMGEGPDVLMVHGTATDRSTWAIQLGTLRKEYRMIAPTRRGADGARLSVRDHADDLATLLDALDIERALVVGSSFGAVIALEMLKRHTERVRGAILMEPPLAQHDSVPLVPFEFGCLFDGFGVLRGGPHAAEMFLRFVLSDDAWEKIPGSFQGRLVSSHQHIRSDWLGLTEYRVDYPRLRAIEVPTLLVGGSESPARYSPTLDALARSLGRGERATIEGAGHMMHAEDPGAFAGLLRRFCASLR